MQETPRDQQCTTAPTEGDNTVDEDNPRGNHGLSEDQEQTQPQLREVSPRPGPRPPDPTNFIPGEEPGQEPPRSQQTSPIHESSSTSTPSMERPIDKEYATGMDEILTAVEALQITQQKVQVQARLHSEVHTTEVPITCVNTAQDTPRSAPVPPEDHCDTDSSLISIPFTPQTSPLPWLTSYDEFLKTLVPGPMSARSSSRSIGCHYQPESRQDQGHQH